MSITVGGVTTDYSEPISCDEGKYCANWAGAAVTGDCFAGYYCSTSSTVPNQYVCPPGYYCPEGSGKIACQAGTY